MLIGLLEAETLPERVVARFGSYGNMFEQRLRRRDASLEFRYYAADQGQLPTNLDECDAYIITGSRFNAYDRDPWIENLKAFVRDLDRTRKRCLGICFGHQLIAAALGGKVELSDKGWGIGVAKFNVYAQAPWMTEQLNAFTTLVSHQDQVTALPPRSTLFAANDFCPNGGFILGNHIFTLQGHPEFTPEYLGQLIRRRSTVIGNEKSSNTLKLLDKYNDQGVALELVHRFLQASTKTDAC